MAISVLGNGVSSGEHYEDALSVQEAEFSILQRLGTNEYEMLVVQTNLAYTYQSLGRFEEASQMDQNIYSGHLKLQGEEHIDTLRAALNHATSLCELRRFEETKALLRKTVPLAQRVLGESDRITIKMRCLYARALYKNEGATLDHLREAVTTLEDAERIARRVLGGTHPFMIEIEVSLRESRAALRARSAAP